MWGMNAYDYDDYDGYGDCMDCGYGDCWDCGYGDCDDCGYGDCDDCGYGDCDDCGYDDCDDCGYGDCHECEEEEEEPLYVYTPHEVEEEEEEDPDDVHNPYYTTKDYDPEMFRTYTNVAYPVYSMPANCADDHDI